MIIPVILIMTVHMRKGNQLTLPADNSPLHVHMLMYNVVIPIPDEQTIEDTSPQNFGAIILSIIREVHVYVRVHVYAVSFKRTQDLAGIYIDPELFD